MTSLPMAFAHGGKPVLCLGLAPACQRTLVFERFQAGEVNRACETRVSAGGKACNTGLALARLTRPCVVTGLNGGATGRLVAGYLVERGITCAFTRMPGATRTCTTILDRACGVATELVEETPAPTDELLQRFEARGRVWLRRTAIGVLCGTLPPGVPEDYWGRFAAAAQHAGVSLIIDSHAAPLLRALAHKPLLAKMNVRELERTLSCDCGSEQAVLTAARRLTTGGAQWALITHGPAPALLVDRTGAAWRLTPPVITPLNPIGSGDCVNGGIIHAVLDGAELPAAARFGLGCGTANALTLCPADFDPAQARALAAACRMERLA